MPFCRSKVEQVTTEDLVELSEIEKRNLGQIFLDLLDKCGCSSSVFTCSISECCSFCPEGSPNFEPSKGNASLDYRLPWKESSHPLKLEQNGAWDFSVVAFFCSIEIKDTYIPPWIISSICATMGSEGRSFEQVIVFHSGHLSHLLKLSDPIVSSLENPHRRQKTLTAGDLFRRSPFRHRRYHQVHKERSSSFLKARREILSHVPAMRVSSPAPERHALARGALSGHALPPPASPDAF
ncbi:hypothetical protein CK203_091851 [Vitis vinifera]|uniref:Uncharacterized protein n=1 Tax=Vitis vinifera TaxID=29760 RepID=A0A438BM07_VITVI|nr:hypothetical protein CK203_091851 [Vitis vinifera]